MKENTNINFVEIVKQTWQQRYDMYMKCTKEELARMLAERDRITNPEACIDGININCGRKSYSYSSDYNVYDICQSESPEIVLDKCQSPAPEMVKDNCVASNSSCSFDEYTDDNGCKHESYSYTYDEFIADDNPTGITFIG